MSPPNRGRRDRSSHNASDGSGSNGDRRGGGSRRHKKTLKQQKTKVDYSAWKSLITNRPVGNDFRAIGLVWEGALAILNGNDLNQKQMLPQDLDDEDNHGYEHIRILLRIEAHAGGYNALLELVRPFLSVITHTALLDCLSIDTFVGRLYGFISGSGGSRAIPFFRRLVASLLGGRVELPAPSPTTASETILIAMSTALREMLRREQRAASYDGLQDLVDCMETAVKRIIVDESSAAFQVVSNRIGEFRGILARENSLLRLEEEPQVNGIPTTSTASTYPHGITLPRDRHGNDKLDITKIMVFPTEDEVRSDHAEFLPSTDLDRPHFLTDQVGRHLDTHFRLLRHEIFGKIKKVLGRLMIAVENDPTLLENSKINLDNIRAYTYPKAHLSHISFRQRRGLEAQISFPQTFQLRKKSPSDRCKWWEESGRLEEGILLCLLSLNGTKSSLLFFTVTEKRTNANKDYGLSSQNYQATIIAKLATRTRNDMELMIRMSCQNTRGLLIEFPRVLPSTFIPVLKNIQSMQRLSRLPFRQWILPTHVDASSILDIPPPLYTWNPGFRFSLKPILKDAGVDLPMDPRASVGDTAVIDELEVGTGLDRGQCQALIAALTREFAFVQGPPGTGKSYLGVQLLRVLIACKAKARLGPIVVVCYTNHALDQFLEHLINCGIENVIRVGSQSKSTILEGKNLRRKSHRKAKTKFERALRATARGESKDKENAIRSILGSLHGIHKRPSWANLKDYLSRKYPRAYAQLRREDDEGFEKVGREPFDAWIEGEMSARSKQQDKTDFSLESIEQILANAERDIHSLPLGVRHRLIEYWTKEIHKNKTDELFESLKLDDGIRQRLTNINDDVDRRVLQMADVIGVTTTGLAGRIDTFQRVTCKVAICEEAGEVMEPHMISALLPNVEHFIQIGDHQQLRPTINNYKLSLESRQGILYQLDRSQFERLSVREKGRPAFPVVQLNVQRRMRPEISTLIRETMYPRLVDHEITKNLPGVVGMRKNVFWLDHDNMEEGAQEDMVQKSHSNVWEAEMTLALVRHIVRQGVYNSGDIAVLTPYSEQLQKLRAKMRNDFEIFLSGRDQETLTNEGFGIGDTFSENEQTSNQSGSGKEPLEKKKLGELLRLATVDNFQGEESKVVIVSLVRSNKEKRVGFLRTNNRINVLLSRAKHGLYLIGNADTYYNIPMWARVHDILQATGSVGKAFGLCCSRHPDTEIQVSQPGNFATLSPEGGCQLFCDRNLPDCGHPCRANCHSESMHRVFACPEPCQRVHSPCNHNCQKQTCGEDCGPCLVRSDNVQLLCGHSKDNVACYLTRVPDEIICTVPVTKLAPSCNHTVDTQCSQDVTSENFSCPTACRADLECGHACRGACGRCNQKDRRNRPTAKHDPCAEVCGQRFGTCEHTCRKRCHGGKDCGLCLSCRAHSRDVTKHRGAENTKVGKNSGAATTHTGKQKQK